MSSALPRLTVILPTKREAANLPWLFEHLHTALRDPVGALEILVVDTPTGDDTAAVCREYGVRYLGDPKLTFAAALRVGFREAQHELVVTMDADGSHDPVHIPAMLRLLPDADVVIASRYGPGGGQVAPWFRCFTSRVLNAWLRAVCGVPIRDVSGGFRLYRRTVLRAFDLDSRYFEIQCELATKAHRHGFRLRELPFVYRPRRAGRSNAAMVRYGWAFLCRSLRLRAYRPTGGA